MRKLAAGLTGLFAFLIELELAASDRASAARQVEAMCEQLLANPVIETYAVSLDD